MLDHLRRAGADDTPHSSYVKANLHGSLVTIIPERPTGRRGREKKVKQYLFLPDNSQILYKKDLLSAHEFFLN